MWATIFNIIPLIASVKHLVCEVNLYLCTWKFLLRRNIYNLPQIYYTFTYVLTISKWILATSFPYSATDILLYSSKIACFDTHLCRPIFFQSISHKLSGESISGQSFVFFATSILHLKLYVYLFCLDAVPTVQYEQF